MESEYNVRLASIASREEVGEFVEAKLERFALIESFSGFLHSLASHGEDELSGTKLELWKVFKAQLIKLITTRNRTRVELHDRLPPIIESIKPLLRYFDKEELSIFVQHKFLDRRLIEFFNDIEKTKQMLASEDKKLSECEQILTNSISRMRDLYEERQDDQYSLRPILAQAHCLRAFCSQEDLCRKENLKSNSNHIMQDAQHALVYWNAMPTLPKKHLLMLCHLHDLLSLKGNTYHHSMVYEIMLKSFDSKSKDESDSETTKNELKDWCHILWHSRRVSHTFCGSPVCEVFLQKLSKYCGWYDDGETWKSGMNDIDAVGFQHKLALSSYVPYNQDSHGDLSINQVQQVATNQLQNDPLSSHSNFVVSHLYYDLAQTLVAKGSMIEAMFYARGAYKLRRELLQTKFCLKPQEKTINYDKMKSESIYNYEICGISRQVATAPWPREETSSESTNLIMTPWNILQCFLESTLQCGDLEDDVMHARKLLLNGKTISCSLRLSVFSIQFSQALGRFYFKQQKWELAEVEIKKAQELWDNVNKSHISCLKCKTILEVSIKQLYGDLNLEMKTTKGSRIARSYYNNAEAMLKLDFWKNKFSCPKKVCGRTFCGECGISWGSVAENDDESCWHRQASRIMESNSLESVSYMKVEYLRRSILIRLFARIGKWHRLQYDKSSEKRVLFERLSGFVIRNTLNGSTLCESDDFISKIVRKRLTGFAYVIDYATTVYEICCFFLRAKRKTPGIIMENVVCGLKIAFMLSSQVPTLHQEVSRLLGILYTLNRVPRGHNVTPSVAQWASFFHNSSIGAYFNNSLIERMRKEEGPKPIKDNTEGNLEEWVLQFFRKLPQLPIICFSIYGDDFLLPSNILPRSPTSVWIQLSRLGSDKVPIFVSIIPIESSLKDTVYGALRVKVPRSSKKGNPTAFNKVASVFNSVYEVRDILYDEVDVLDYKRWMKLVRKLDDYVSAILSDLETDWFSHHKWVLLGDTFERPVDVLSTRSPVILVMDPELQSVPLECMNFLKEQDIYRMPSMMSILSTLQRSCSYEETGVFPTVDPSQVYYVLNAQKNLPDCEEELLPVFENNNFTGIAGEFPSSDLLKDVLKTKEIFLYIGHGSGLNSMMSDVRETLDSRACMVLMACSSGSINLNGSYNPSGLILDYLLSGSPAIASTTWSVMGFYADRMIKKMVEYWETSGCSKTMASSVAFARQSCDFQYIDGAGFICYGIPTRIESKGSVEAYLEDGSV